MSTWASAKTLLNEIKFNQTFKSETTISSGYFYFEDNSQVQSANSTNKSKYTWLYDNLYNCVKYGCDVQDDNNYTLYGKTTTGTTQGYWTNNPVYDSSSKSWYVHYYGYLYYSGSSADYCGIRPVISIPKYIIE